jgi:hypothetical protein
VGEKKKEQSEVESAKMLQLIMVKKNLTLQSVNF